MTKDTRYIMFMIMAIVPWGFVLQPFGGKVQMIGLSVQFFGLAGLLLNNRLGGN